MLRSHVLIPLPALEVKGHETSNEWYTRNGTASIESTIVSARLDGAISEELVAGTVPSERQLCLVKRAGEVGRVSDI